MENGDVIEHNTKESLKLCVMQTNKKVLSDGKTLPTSSRIRYDGTRTSYTRNLARKVKDSKTTLMNMPKFLHKHVNPPQKKRLKYQEALNHLHRAGRK